MCSSDPCSHAGVVKEIKIKVGDKIAEGSLVLMLEAGAEPATDTAAPPAELSTAAAAEAKPTGEDTNADKTASPPAKAEASAGQKPEQKTVEKVEAQPDTKAESPATLTTPAPGASGLPPHASPSIRKFARELGVDLSKVAGSGPKGRIVQADVQNYVKQALTTSSTANAGKSGAKNGGGSMDLLPWPSLDFSKFGTTELLPLSRIKKISGPNLHRNWVMIPHVTQFDEADVTELEEFRKDSNTSMAKSGIKLTMLAFVIKASVAALKKFPAFNASLDAAGENLILKQFYNIGFAADTPNGLVVPVIKNADQKGVAQIAQEMADMSAQAREGKLKPADMQGATFTISSLGGIGGTAFTPIINAPEVAILGLSKSAIKPVWDGKAFQPRLMMPMSLSYDHRVVDGAMGARFSVYLSEVLGDMRKILL